MTNIRSAIAKGAVLTMAVLKTCHGFYVPGVRPHEFISGEDVPMKVNAMTSVHTQVSLNVVAGDTGRGLLALLLLVLLRTSCLSYRFTCVNSLAHKI
jgi:hypothetical protein